jgi:hypothetical protein
MIRFKLPKWLSPKLAAASVPVEEVPDTVYDPSDAQLVLEAPDAAIEARPPNVTLVRTMVEAAIDQAWGPSSGQAAYHARQIMKHGLTEDLTTFVDFIWTQTGQEPTEASIREMLPHVRSFRGQGITAEGGRNLMNFGRRYMTDERCEELLGSLVLDRTYGDM